MALWATFSFMPIDGWRRIAKRIVSIDYLVRDPPSKVESILFCGNLSFIEAHPVHSFFAPCFILPGAVVSFRMTSSTLSLPTVYTRCRLLSEKLVP